MRRRLMRDAIRVLACAAAMIAWPVWAAPDTETLTESAGFSLKPAELLEIAGRVPQQEEYGVQVLLEDGRYTIDLEGRVTFRVRMIYRIDAPGSVASWSRVSQSWRPWYEERPEIRARVITPEGEEYSLDPADLGEYTAGDDGPHVYGDRKTLRGPLPAVKVGAVVEEERVVRGLEPEFIGGGIRTFNFGKNSPVQLVRLIVEAPPEIPLRYKVHRLPGVEPSRSNLGDRIRLEFVGGPFKAWSEDVREAPPDVARRPMVRFSTGSSWKDLARAYSTIVDEKILGADLKKLVKKTVGKETDSARMISALLELLHEKVRYTGVEFGEQSLIPTAPGETLERRFGDCKDKSTLLVAMLREAGIESHLALLKTGPGNDVDPELPGVSRFNHAIVHVAGIPELWIDPTHPFARAGELPGQDQGRLALIASGTSTELVRTPKNGSSDNVRREFREVFFATQGAGRVVETTEVSGSFERTYRSSFSKQTVTGLRDQLENYIKTQYDAERLGRMEVSDSADLSSPMRVEIEAVGSKKVWTSSTEASASIAIGSLVRDLPQILRPDVVEKESDEGDQELRPHPVVLQQPYVAEVNYRIEPPAGYALTATPDDRDSQLGPATLSTKYETGEDGTVKATLRFDTVKSRYSPQEVRAIKTELAAFYKESIPQVVFHQVGEAHLEAGRIREALEEFQGLVERFPEEALYRTQVARAYLAAGLGGSAREAASQAVKLDPASALAHQTLGIILAHDDLGRKFAEGLDHAGAESALRKAKELDEEDFIARGELAILLEHDPEGRRYAAGARLDEAAHEYESLRSELDNEGLTSNLFATRLHEENFEEIRGLWKESPRNAFRDGIYLATLAATDGTEATIKEASRIADQADAYRERLIAASDWLNEIRRYPEAATLLSAGARGGTDSVSRLALADMIRKVKLHETVNVSLETPKGVALSFLSRLVRRSPDGQGILDLFLPELLAGADHEMIEVLEQDLGETVEWSLRQSGLSGDRALDWILSLATLTVDGTPETGYRVRLRSLGPGDNSLPLTFYVVPSGDEHRLAGFKFAWAPTGKLLLSWIEEGRLDSVRRWLDWISEDALEDRTDDVLNVMPLRWLWTVGEEGDAERMRLAAASLMVDGTYGDEAEPILRSGLESHAEGEMRVGLDVALSAVAEINEDWTGQLENVTRLHQTYPRSAVAFTAKVNALIRLERYDEAEALIKQRSEKMPGESITGSLFADLARIRGDLPEHRVRLGKLIESGRATSGEYNNLAWLDIVEARVSEETLSNAQQAVTLTNYSEPASLHTLATVYAELEYLTEARDVLLALLDNRSSSELESPDWYVLGRMAEQYGVEQAALEAYAKVEPPGELEPDETSTHALAARRIKAIKSRREKKN